MIDPSVRIKHFSSPLVLSISLSVSNIIFFKWASGWDFFNPEDGTPNASYLVVEIIKEK